MSVSSYKKPDIQTDFSSIPTWIYLILVAVLYTFGAYSFFDYITSSDPEKVSNLETLSEGFSALVPLELPFLLLFLAFIVIFLFFRAYHY